MSYTPILARGIISDPGFLREHREEFWYVHHVCSALVLDTVAHDAWHARIEAEVR